MRILAIESSCDETAAAIIESEKEEMRNEKEKTHNSSLGTQILSNIVASQIDLHKQYGGVFPEIASRSHSEQIIPVIGEALESIKTCKMRNEDKNSHLPSLISSSIDLIAVTAGPGLIGSLLIGVNAAKTLSYAFNKPIIGINHWLGHIYSAFGGESDKKCEMRNEVSEKNLISHSSSLPSFPLLALIVSGGHTGLVLMKSHTEYETIGETLDDAAGEAFDKVAKLLELGYPGGPAISKAAASFKKHDLWEMRNEKKLISHLSSLHSFSFPRSMLGSKDYNFSFSGLKTSVLYKVKELTNTYHLKPETYTAAIAAEFQQAVIDILIGKTLKAAEEFKPKSILLCGGVSANKELRTQMAKAIKDRNEKNINLISQTSSPITFHLQLVSCAPTKSGEKYTNLLSFPSNPNKL